MKPETFFLGRTGHEESHDATADKTEPPVNPSENAGDESGQIDRLGRGSRDGGQPAQNFFYQGRAGKGMTGDKNEHHLHAERQKFPETLVPVLNHLQGALPGDDDAQNIGDEGQDHGKDEGIRHVFPGPAGQQIPQTAQYSSQRLIFLEGAHAGESQTVIVDGIRIVGAPRKETFISDSLFFSLNSSRNMVFINLLRKRFIIR